MSVEGGADDVGGVMELFDQLEELVAGARRVPLSASVVAEAEAQAAATRAEADAYARDVMVRLEDQLARTIATVRRGVEALPPPPGARRRRQGAK